MGRTAVLMGILALGLAAQAGSILVQSRGVTTASAPASEEVTVVKLIQVSYLDVAKLTAALGGYTVNLFGAGHEPLGVIPDAGDALRNLFTGGGRDAAAPDFSAR